LPWTRWAKWAKSCTSFDPSCMGIHIKQINSGRMLRQFIGFPLRLYRSDPHFVPHLLWERKQFFNPHNPLFRFTEVAYFLAYDATGRVVGRITAHINRRHNEFHGERTGFFGFFEAVNSRDVAQGLLNAAERWLAARGMSKIRGPFNFSTNEECGLLIEGFDTPPVIMMTHGKRYYPALVSQLGYRKAKDLLAYDIKSTGAVPRFLARFARRVRNKTHVRVRPIQMDNLKEDIRKAFGVYESAWQKNWGFVPMSTEEFDYTANSLKPLLDPSLALVAEVGGQAVGFCLALPDYNVLFKRMGGRLLPTGIFYLLFGRCLIERIRVLLFGVVEQYRRSGVDMLLLYHLFTNGMARGYTAGECSWILEDNLLMRRALDRIGAVPYKTYRIYEKEL